MSGPPFSDAERQAVISELRAGAPRLIADLTRLIRIPSVSWDGFDPQTLEASSRLLEELLVEVGLFDHVGIHRHGAGQPAVVARREPRAGAPTVVLYAHHDVQPPGPDEDWDSPPFEPVIRAGRLYGRGSADDTAGIAVHLAALRVLAAAEEPLALGLVVFIEGEEENGSPSFAGFLEEFQSLLVGDIIIVADSDNPTPAIPALTTSLRGNVTAVVTVRTLEHAVHSGMFGGVLPDAMTAFVALASSFYRPDGSLAIVGLDAESTGEPHRGRSDTRTPGMLEGVIELGRGSREDRLWRQAALTITGIDAPSVAHASNTLLPEVRAKISLRVPPGMASVDALASLRAHIDAHAPFGARCLLTDVSLGEPFLASGDSPAHTLAAEALAAGFGMPAVFQGVGGSIPFISQLAEAFPSAHIVVTGVEDPETRAHSPNESLHLGVLWRQALSETLYLRELNRRKVSDFIGD